MNKDSIYKLIGYTGDYNKEVKTKLRKLLKKYHPDHNNGKDETFKLINEVKKELENNKNNKYNDTYKDSKNSKINKENFDYYKTRINTLNNENKILENEINEKNSLIEQKISKYSSLNDKLNNNHDILCQYQEQIRSLDVFHKRYYIYIILILIFAIANLINKNILFILLLIIVLISIILDVFGICLKKREIKLKSNNYITKAIEIYNKMQRLKEKIEIEKKDLLLLKRRLNKNNDDIRFYQNQLNKK